MPQQQGVALLTILLLAALASILLVDMLGRHELGIAQTRYTLHQQEGLAHALGLEAWVRHLLYRDLVEDNRQPPVDGLQDAWAEPEVPFQLDDGAELVRLSVRDLEGRFNLNALANDAAAQDRFRRLLDNLGLDPVLAEQAREWVTVQDDGVPGQGDYLAQDPPYRAARGPMASISELRLLTDMDPASYRTLEPYLSVLPPAVRSININTAPPPVLAALAPDMDPMRADEYAYPAPPWNMPGDLLGEEAGFAPEQGALTTRTRFFELQAEIRVGQQLTRLRSVIYRDPSSGVTRVTERDITGHGRWAETRPGWPFEEN